MEKAIILAKLSEFTDKRAALQKKEMELKHELGEYNEEFGKFMYEHFEVPPTGQMHLVDILQKALNLP